MFCKHILGFQAEVLQFEGVVLPTHARFSGVQCHPEELQVVDFVDASLTKIRWRQAEVLHEHLIMTHIQNHMSLWYYHCSAYTIDGGQRHALCKVT
jgi:hypothetical protein